MYTSRTEGLHSKDKIWALFIDDARKFDETRMQRWKGDAEGILIFTGLFAATVANFLVDSGLPLLSPDSGGQTVDILQDILAVLSNNTNNKTPALSLPVTADPAVSRSSIWINALWSISLFISVFCALSATLIQQWIRDYTHDVYRRGHVGLRGPSYAILSLGVERFKMEHAVASIVTLIHISVALFFAGFLVMMYTTNEAIASALASFVVLGILAYMLLSVMSVIWPDTPYRTPLTPLFYVIVQYMIYASTIAYRAWCRFALHWKLRWIEWYYQDRHGRLTHRMRTVYSYRADIVAPATPVQLNFWKTRLGYIDQHFSNWDDHLWAPRLFYTMKQIYTSLERIEETEEFWVAAAPHLLSQYSQWLDFRTKSMELVLVKDLRIFWDMSRILERCLYGNLAGDPQWEYLRIEPILVAFALVRCVLRSTLRRNKIRAARPFREFPTPTGIRDPVCDAVYESLVDSKVARFASYRHKLPPGFGQRATFALYCSQAALRGDLLAIRLADAPRIGLFNEHTNDLHNQVWVYEVDDYPASTPFTRDWSVADDAGFVWTANALVNNALHYIWMMIDYPRAKLDNADFGASDAGRMSVMEDSCDANWYLSLNKITADAVALLRGRNESFVGTPDDWLSPKHIDYLDRMLAQLHLDRQLFVEPDEYELRTWEEDRHQWDYSDMPPPIAPYDEYFERWPVLRDVFTALARELLRHPPPPRPQDPPVDSEFMTSHAQESSQDHSAYSTAPETPRQVHEEAVGERGLEIDSSVYLTADNQSGGSPSPRERDLEAPSGTDDGAAESERRAEPAPFPQLDPRKDPENWY